jgi:hypothetical protein
MTGYLNRKDNFLPRDISTLTQAKSIKTNPKRDVGPISSSGEVRINKSGIKRRSGRGQWELQGVCVAREASWFLMVHGVVFMVDQSGCEMYGTSGGRTKVCLKI